MPDYKEAEFRGTDNLWIAEITKDDSTGYTFLTPVNLAPTGQISRQVNSSSETHYYSNVGMIVIVTKGGETATITTPVLPLAKLALVTGQTYDETTGALISGDLEEKYFALIYRVQLTDNSWRYVVKYKAQLTGVPEEVSQTRSDGVNTNNQQLVFTCNETVYEFTNGGHADGIALDERDGLCDFSTFFDTVYTPDTIGQIANSAVTALAVAPATASVAIGKTEELMATVTPSTAKVAWRSSNANVASVSSAGVVTGVSAGTAVITASAGAQAASCTVTVTAG